MKKKYLIISISVLLVLTTCLYVFMSSNTERVVISNENGNSIVNNNALTMMYETEYQSGEYQVSSDTTFEFRFFTKNIYEFYMIRTK